MEAGRWSDKIQPEKVGQIHCFFFILEDNASEKSNQSLLGRAGEHRGGDKERGGFAGGGMRWRNG